MLTPLFAPLAFPIIVLDLEWNQHYAGQLDDLPQEIVEIGAVRLDEDLRITGQLGLLVRPQVNTRMHHHVRRLTGISTSETRQGQPFPVAAEAFLEFCGPKYTLCTWGRDDLPVLWKNFVYWKLPMPHFGTAVNLQMAYDHLFSATPSMQTALQKAMEEMGVTEDLPAHRALNDALFTALVLQKMNLRLQESPAPPEQIKALDQAFQEQILRLSERREVLNTTCRRLDDVLGDEELIACLCPLCQARLFPQTPVLQAGPRTKFQQLYTCEQHGDVLTSLQMQKQRNGFFRLRKSSMLTTAERADKVRRTALLLPPPKSRRSKKRKPKDAPASPATETSTGQ